MTNADTTNDTAFTPNTMSGLFVTASSAPPSAGPTAIPESRLALTRLFAHVVSSGPATLGIAASEAEKNGASATADRNAHVRSHAGSDDSAIIPKQHRPGQLRGDRDLPPVEAVAEDARRRPDEPQDAEGEQQRKRDPRRRAGLLEDREVQRRVGRGPARDRDQPGGRQPSNGGSGAVTG